MGYFPVDDQMSFHPKVMAAGNAAIGLWTRAGSWSKNHATGGFVDTNTAAAMGSRAEIRKLVDVGLWEEVLGGYYFHDWEHYGANTFGADEEAARDARREAKREADRIRQQRKRDRERDALRDSHAAERDESGVTGPVTGPVTVTPEVTPQVTASSRARWTSPSPSPSPSPVVVFPDQSPVPETSRDTSPDPEAATPEQKAAAARFRVDFDKIADRLAVQAGERVPAAVTARVIAEAVRRAKPRDGDRTGLVLTSVTRDWAEWSRLVFQVAS